MNLGKGTNILFSWFQQEEDTEGNNYGKQTNKQVWDFPATPQVLV